LRCLTGHSPEHPVVAEILLQVSNLRPSGQSVVVWCVPGRRGLPGREAADAAAVHGPLVSNRTPGTDVCTCLP
jgi:hypothetical protein